LRFRNSEEKIMKTLLAILMLCALSQSASSTPSSQQEPGNPQSEVHLDSPYALALYPPGKVKADLVSDCIKLDWTVIPLERIRGYVVYWKDGDGWHRAGVVNRPPYTLKVTKGMLDAQFSVATLDKTGLESKKSAPVKVFKEK
jgi:hypothetical protein